jgi:hypothetical protein
MRRGAWLLTVAAIALAPIAAHGCARDAASSPIDASDADAQVLDARSGGALHDAPTLSTEDASDPLAAGCATATADVTRQPIYMLLLLDGSGSMNDEGKWTAMVPTLSAFFDDLELQKDPSFGVGLTVFSDTKDTTKGAGPYPAIDVPIAFIDAAHGAALRARLATTPQGPTPTLAVLTGQYPLIEAFTPSPPLLANGKKVVVLMTDGVPYPDSDTQKGPCVQAAQNELAKTAPAGPVTTFAVGIGHYFPYDPTTYDPAFMGDLAIAGGAPNQPCTPHELYDVSHMCHFQVTPAAQGLPFQLEHDLRAAFDKIRSEVTSCALTLDKADGGQAVDPSKVNVVFTNSNGKRIVLVEDPKDGWSYDDPNAPSQVILNGAACQMLKNDPDGRLVVVLGCKTIVK